jgi:hypothetical protein
MKLDENLAAIHAYLCADGYVIKNPITQRHKYFHIGFRNTNLILLQNFQKRFEKYFKTKPHLIEGQRCRIGSKELYEKLTKEFGSFYSWKWRMPKLNDKLSKIWLRAYFDCESWVTCKKHQNRCIGVDCVNEKGINQIKEALDILGIKTILKKRNTRNIFSLKIYGKENLIKFKEKIGFLHPNKKERLNQALNDFVIYKWKFPKDEKECKQFIKNILIEKIRIKKPHYIRIFSKEEINLINLSRFLKKFYGVKCIVSKRINGIGTIYYELNINRKEEIQKLINSRLIKDILKNIDKND